MYTQRRRLVLRSPAVALLTAMALALFPAAAQSTDYDGLVTGCAGAAFFDPASLEAAYGLSFQTAPVQTAEEGFRAAYKAISFGKIDHLIYCLDGSEAASGYTSDIPRAADDLEKIGQADLYMAAHGGAFTSTGSTHTLDRQNDIISKLTEIKKLCTAKKIRFTLVFLPLHASRYDSLDQSSLNAYKKALCKVADLWDFSRTDLSADARYFYSRDCARSAVLDLLLDRMTGKAVPFAHFGEKLTAKNVDAGLKNLSSFALPLANSYSKNVPILLYHHITENPSSRADISPATFRAHMEALKKAGYTAVTAADMIAYVEEGKSLPANPVWITFDDGYASNYTLAYPILRELGLRATVFTIGSSIGKTTYKNTAYPITPHFSQKQAEEMMASGVIEIQSHTWDMHQSESYESGAARTTATPLPGETPLQYLTALRRDLETYEAKTGLDFYALAYPKGQYTRESERIYHELGIKLTVSTATDRENTLLRSLPQSLYALCRHDIPEGLSPDALLALIG